MAAARRLSHQLACFLSDHVDEGAGQTVQLPARLRRDVVKRAPLLPDRAIGDQHAVGLKPLQYLAFSKFAGWNGVGASSNRRLTSSGSSTTTMRRDD